MRRNLDLLDKAIQGTVVMSMDLESMAASFLDGKVPMKFEAPLGYPSLKPLGSWVTDLVLRVEFLAKWLYEGAPSSYWLSAFFFPQGFMTAAL
jgi:dynein heavy chain